MNQIAECQFIHIRGMVRSAEKLGYFLRKIGFFFVCFLVNCHISGDPPYFLLPKIVG